MNPRVTEILERATPQQRLFVFKRLTNTSIPKAAHAMGINRTTPHHWDNLDELEEAVDLLSFDLLPAAHAALESLAMDAVQALARGLVRKDAASIRAAEAVLDRIGLPAMRNIDLTSLGEQIQAVVYIPDNGRDDRDNTD